MTARLPAQQGMSNAAKVIRSAQHGVVASHYFPTSRRTQQPVITALDTGQQMQVIDVFIELLEGLYAHLPLKRAMYGVDPVQRLRLLRRRVDELDAMGFHYALAGIVTGLRDAHTRYVGPSELDGCAAMLPFLVEAYGDMTAPRYVVSNVVADRTLIGDRFFKAGVEIRSWNAVPMDRAVDRHADDETGGRPDTRRARALESMTLRALRYSPPPDETSVTVGYVGLDRVARELRIKWRIVQPGVATSGHSVPGKGDRSFGLDPAAETHRQVKMMLFAPKVWLAARTGVAPAQRPVADGQWLPTAMPDAVAAKIVTVRKTRLGYLRLWSFDVADDEAYLDEVTRLLALLPDRGLIIDLRANPGGLIWAAERLLQLFTPRTVAPTRFSLLATALTREMAAAPQNENELRAWRKSLDDAVTNGEPYSRAVAITPPAACNDRGQVYGGPVVAIVDPNTYSAGDLFAAGFTDNEIGPLISVGKGTGAGGANVWFPQQIEDALLATPHQQQPLPAGIGYTLSVRRATRAGAAEGTEIEDVGVPGDYKYPMTKRDLTGSNEGLVAFAGRILLGQPRAALTAEAPEADGAPLTVRTLGIDRLDVSVDDLAQASRKVTTRETSVDVPAGWSTIEVRGSTNGQLVQRRLLRRAT